MTDRFYMNRLKLTGVGILPKQRPS